jgi:hypothetical protein
MTLDSSRFRLHSRQCQLSLVQRRACCAGAYLTRDKYCMKHPKLVRRGWMLEAATEVPPQTTPAAARRA